MRETVEINYYASSLFKYRGNCDGRAFLYLASAARVKALFCFGSLVILDVARCYLWLFSLYMNIKIGKHSC